MTRERRYLVAANAEMRESARLGPKEAGNTMYVQGRRLITVNANDRAERRRFTVLHEIAHIVLDLPSKHSEGITDDTLYSYVRRPPEEVICDTFAAECLLPPRTHFARSEERGRRMGPTGYRSARSEYHRSALESTQYQRGRDRARKRLDIER